mmetsp:Transcript_14625/g.43860  ORF Transcript_14625/g.43860 Transcript_14625/m.43860 type:complete len:422 (+) Transcript_14625:124-1389(+)
MCSHSAAGRQLCAGASPPPLLDARHVGVAAAHLHRVAVKVDQRVQLRALGEGALRPRDEGLLQRAVDEELEDAASRRDPQADTVARAKGAEAGVPSLRLLVVLDAQADAVLREVENPGVWALVRDRHDLLQGVRLRRGDADPKVVQPVADVLAELLQHHLEEARAVGRRRERRVADADDVLVAHTSHGRAVVQDLHAGALEVPAEAPGHRHRELRRQAGDLGDELPGVREGQLGHEAPRCQPLAETERQRRHGLRRHKDLPPGPHAGQQGLAPHAARGARQRAKGSQIRQVGEDQAPELLGETLGLLLGLLAGVAQLGEVRLGHEGGLLRRPEGERRRGRRVPVEADVGRPPEQLRHGLRPLEVPVAAGVLGLLGRRRVAEEAHERQSPRQDVAASLRKLRPPVRHFSAQDRFHPSYFLQT